MPELVVSALNKTFEGNAALTDIEFTVRDGEFFTLLGPSGCGKSTTLMSIAGLETPDSGRITVGDRVFFDGSRRKNLAPEERQLGLVFQSYALWPNMSVEQHLELPLKLRKVRRGERNSLIADALEQVGLTGFEKRYPHQLSGGQQQRVALARAIVYSPSVLLLDEPLSNLDAKLRERARVWLKDLQKRVGVTTVYVTHDQVEALTLSDRIAVMQHGQMLQVGTPQEIYDRPASAEVADFVGRCNFLAARIAAVTPSGLELAFDGGEDTIISADPGGLAVGDRVTVAARAERIRLRPRSSKRPASAVAATIIKSAYAGSRYEYEVDFLGQTVRAEMEEELEAGIAWMDLPVSTTRVFAGEFSSAMSARL